jgi:hypothetical protein
VTLHHDDMLYDINAGGTMFALSESSCNNGGSYFVSGDRYIAMGGGVSLC